MSPSLPAENVKFKHLKLVFQYLANNFLTFLLILIISTISSAIFLLGLDEQFKLWNSLVQQYIIPILCSLFLFTIISILYFMSKPKTIYLLDYALHKSPASLRSPYSRFREHSRLCYKEDSASFEFVMKIYARSGLGDCTSLPTGSQYIPPIKPTLEASREEAELVLFSAIDSLIKKTGIKPSDIDILVLNCSLFSTTPSLTAMIMNKYKMRCNTRSFNLSGMGCSAGLLSVDLARNLLQVHPNSYALVISTEIITPGSYNGKQRSMLVSNYLFRMGASALLLSNHRRDRFRSKYSLLHLVRTHKGAEDKAYKCVFVEEDEEGIQGISLSKELVSIAGETLKKNIMTISPLILPASEQLMYLFTLLCRKLLNPKRKLHIPDFKLAVEHFCIHAGGKSVIDQVQKNLKLTDELAEASRMTLHRFGNTSSSSLWYELNYIEAKGRMKKGDRVWQIAFGSGFKCNSAVWRCNRSIETAESDDSPWLSCIDKYPFHISDIGQYLD